MKSAFVVAAISLGLAASTCPFCEKKEGTFIGETKVMGNGTVRSWITIDKAGKPTAIGITYNDMALEGLSPDLPNDGSGMIGYEYTLALPKEAHMTPFDHLSVDWNPKGHIPPGIYDVPHFDFHFYTVPVSVRKQITLDKASMKKCQMKPATAFMPKGYMYAPGGEYKYMGAHWVDTATPELHGKPFTHTFIYGSFDSSVIFIEPMVAMSYLQSKTNAWAPIKQPEKVAKKGLYYPTKYSIKYDPVRKEQTVTLFGFVKR